VVHNAGPGLEEVNRFISVTGVLTCKMTEGSKKMDSNMARKGCGILTVPAFSPEENQKCTASSAQIKSTLMSIFLK